MSIDLIFKYFPLLTENQKECFLRLPALYSEWNQNINVISRKDIEYLSERHILHSLGIAKVINFKPGTEVLDVGTGGGFPGIPLAILFPEVKFTLIDSIGKKIKVVNAVIENLDLKNVKGQVTRVEGLKQKFDFVVSRAVTGFPIFYSWVKYNIKRENFNDLSNGILYLKGGDLEEEMKGFENRVRIYSLSDYFEEEFFETKKVVYCKPF